LYLCDINKEKQRLTHNLQNEKLQNSSTVHRNHCHGSLQFINTTKFSISTTITFITRDLCYLFPQNILLYLYVCVWAK